MAEMIPQEILALQRPARRREALQFLASESGSAGSAGSEEWRESEIRLMLRLKASRAVRLQE
eukprot:4989024-Karenia_brevis.AAC.1